MTNAYRDENNVPTLIATSNTDGKSIIRVLANASNHSLKVDDDTTGTDHGNNNGIANRDENNVPVFIAVSSADGITPVEVYVDSSGKLLIDSN